MENFLNLIKETKKNHPTEYRQFLFGITIAILDIIQIAVIFLVFVSLGV